MPILFIHPSDDGYGLDRVVLTLMVGMRDRGEQVHAVLPDDGPSGWLSAQLTREGLPFSRLNLGVARRRYLRPASLMRYPLQLLRTRRALRREARRLSADIIHISGSSLPVGAILGRPNRASLVWHVHELVTDPVALAWLFRLIPVLSADLVVGPSRAVRNNLARVRVRTDRIRCIHNGIDCKVMTPRATRDGHPKVAFVGRLNRWKGYDVFLKAVEQVAPAHPEARFVIVGSAPAGEEWRVDGCRKAITDLKLEDRVEMIDFTADLRTFMSVLDVFVAPSIWPDPFPTVVLEAMRAGCAVVSSDHGGAPEMIDDGLSGLLVPPGDVDALSAAISRLLDDASLTRALGKAASARVVEHFSDERYVAEMAAAYGRLRNRQPL